LKKLLRGTIAARGCFALVAGLTCRLIFTLSF